MRWKRHESYTDGDIPPKSLQVNGATIELAVQFERNGEGGVSFKVFGVEPR